MITSFLLSLCARTANITYSCPAMRLEQVVKTLSEKSGEKLLVTKNLEGKMISLNFNDVPIEEALARIAKCYQGKWVESGQTRILQLPSTASSSSSSNATWLVAIQKHLKASNGDESFGTKECDELLQNAMKLSEGGENNPDYYQKFRDLESKAPKSRFVRRLINQIGAKTLADLPDETRSVFSLRPNRMQRQLPNSCSAAVETLVRELKLHNEALAKKGITAENRYQGSYYSEIFEPREQVNLNYTDMLVIVKKTMSNMQVNVLLKGTDYTENMSDFISLGREEDLKQEPQKIKVDGEFEPSKDSILLGKLINNMNNQGNQDGISTDERKKVLEFFSDLEKNELLSLAPSEFVQQVATAMKRDYVAAFDDISIYLLSFAANQEKAKLQTAIQQASFVWNLEDDGKALIVSPSNKMPFGNFEIPRRAVSKFVRDVAKEGITIEALADLAINCPENEAGSFVIMIANLPFFEKKFDMDFQRGAQTLRIFGSLDSATKKRAKSEEVKLTFGSLNPATQKLITKFVFNEMESPSSTEYSSETAQVYGNGPDIERDPTNIFVGGIPMNTQIVVRLKKMNSLFVVDEYDGGYTSVRTASVEDAARTLAWAEKTRGQEGYRQNTKLAMGSLDRLDIGIIFGKGSNSHLRYDLQPKFSKKDYLDVSQLPEADRKAMEEQLKIQREQLKDVKIESSRPPRIKP